MSKITEDEITLKAYEFCGDMGVPGTAYHELQLQRFAGFKAGFEEGRQAGLEEAEDEQAR